MAARPRHARRPSTLKCLVWALRCLGLYCYKKSSSAAAADAVEISLPLLLWAVFVKTYQLALFVYEGFRIMEVKMSLVSDVGELTATLSMLVSGVVPLLGQTSLLFNGNILCQIWSECEEDVCLRKTEKGSGIATIFSMEGIVTLIFYCSFTVGILLPFIVPATDSSFGAFELAAIDLVYVTAEAGILLSSMLFREVLAIAARKLSFAFLLDASIFESGASGADPRLDKLVVLLQVGNQKTQVEPWLTANTTAG